MESTTSNASTYLLSINHVWCIVHVLLAFYFDRLAQRKAHSRRPKGSTYFATSTPFPREEWPRMRKDTFYAHLFSIEICHAFEIARLARCFQVDVPYEQLCTSLFAIFNNSLKIYMYELHWYNPVCVKYLNIFLLMYCQCIFQLNCLFDAVTSIHISKTSMRSK